MTEPPDDSSCELPGVPPKDGRRHRHFDGVTWDGVTPQVYKRSAPSSPSAPWRDVVRYTLVGETGEPTAFHLRYFEIGVGGYSSLEKHHYVHAVVVLCGQGKVIVGHEVFDVEPFDLVYVPSFQPHQFVNTGSEPFGFLCPVDADRDRPQPLTEAELSDLLSNPVVREVVRIPDMMTPSKTDPIDPVRR
ncbi:MAG TPA: cupin domain-containing protein [bacterium]|nr:cupin domain-containing protein [bacterium]